MSSENCEYYLDCLRVKARAIVDIYSPYTYNCMICLEIAKQNLPYKWSTVLPDRLQAAHTKTARRCK